MVVAAIATVGAFLLASLVLVLRHLSAMRLTDGEAARLAASIAALAEKLRTLEEKVTLLNNRTQR